MNYWEKLIDGFSFKSKSGAPDFDNPNDRLLLRMELLKKGWNENAVNELLHNLTEKEQKVQKVPVTGDNAKTKGGLQRYYFYDKGDNLIRARTDQYNQSKRGGNLPYATQDQVDDETIGKEDDDDSKGGDESNEQQMITDLQQETSDLRDRGEAGAGGQAASQGESRYCSRLNEGKTEQERKDNDEKWRKENAKSISSEETSIDERKNKARKYPDKIEQTKLTPDEKDVLYALGLKEECVDTGKTKKYKKDGKEIGPVPVHQCTMPKEMKTYLAEREVWAKQELERMRNMSEPNVLMGDDGFGGDEEAYLEWMRASYDSGKATRQILEDSRLDTSKPHTTVQSTPDVDKKVRSQLEEKTQEACKVEDSDDCKYYKKQLKDWDKFSKYHDTFTLGVDDKGRTFVVHISNKKGSHLKDPQNNTTPASRLRMLRDNFPPEVVKNVINTINTGISDVSNAKAASVRAQTEMNVDDDFVELCESESMDKYMRTGKNSLDKRGGSDSNHRFAKWIKSQKPYKKWEDMTTREKLEASQKYCKERLYDKDGKPRLQTTGEILDRFKDKDGNPVKPDNWVGDWPPTKNEDGSEKEYYLTDDGEWKEIKQGLGTIAVGIPYEPFGKIITKAGEISKSTEAEEGSGIAQAKVAKQQEKDTVVETHKKVVQSLHDSDRDSDGDFYHPDNPDSQDKPNGPNTQGYIETTLKAMHFDSYIDLEDEDDDKMIIQMGINGARPSDIKNCLADLSGFPGNKDPLDKEGLKKYLKERCRVDSKSQKIVIVDGEGNGRELIEDTWRTAGTSQKVASHFGKDMRDCVKNKANKRVSA